MRKAANRFAGVVVALAWCLVAVPDLRAATVKPTIDTPLSFRASFTGLDTNAATIEGNDFQVFTFDFWTVLVNLRGDTTDTNGTEGGFYEIQLTRTGSVVADPTAPIVKTYLVYTGLQPNTVLTDSSVSSQPHGSGAEYLSTTVNILFDPTTGTVSFSGTIAGDSDLNGDGIMDSDQITTDQVAKTLLSLKDAGVITGKDMGQIIKQTRQVLIVK